MSHPTARHQRPLRRPPAPRDPYDEGAYARGPYQVAVDGARYGDGGYGEAPYELASFGQSWRERAFLDQARYTEPRYEQDPYGEGFYGDGPHQEAPYGQAFYDQARYHQPQYGQVRYDQAGQVRYDQAGQVRYHQAQYGQVRYHQAQYGQDRHGQDRHGQDRHGQDRHGQDRHGQDPYGQDRHGQDPHGQDPHGQDPYGQDPYGQDPYEQDPYEETRFDEVRSDEAPRTTYERPVPARRKPGAHRHARPSRKRRRPVRLAAAMAGSGLLVAGAVPVAAHWWHRPATHPDADQASLPATPGAASGLSATSHNALDQWAQIPIGKHVAAEAKVAQRARRRAAEHPAPQPSHSPQPAATVSSAYQNPLRAVSDLVLERVDMGVDFGGAGPVYALGDGVITNATDNSSGWPGGGWITYQLTGGPDAGLVVYLAEDVTPSVQVGQKVTSSTVIANMFNGGDGIETGWATSDGSTAESQMAAAGGISGGGPFPTMVGLSFDAVLESVGVPAAPNADQAGSGLLPAGYPPVAG